MKFADVKDHIVRKYLAGCRDTICLIGPPGIGKTSCGRQAAAEIATHYEDGCGFMPYPVPGHDPIDSGGIPAVITVGDEIVARRFPLEELFPTAGRWILLLDDITATTMAAQVSLYPILYDRQIGRLKMSPDCMVVATGNSAKDKAGAGAISTALQRRMQTLAFEPDVAAWSLEMAARGISPVIRAFIAHRPDLICTFDPAIQGPFATLSTWESLSWDMTAYDPEVPPFEAIKGWIGEGPALEFRAFAETASQLVSPDTILMSPTTAPVPEDPGALYAVSAALASRMTAGNAGPAFAYIRRMQQEFQIFTVKSAIAGQKGRLDRLTPDERRKTRLLEHTTPFLDFGAENNDLLS